MVPQGGGSRTRTSRPRPRAARVHTFRSCNSRLPSALCPPFDFRSPLCCLTPPPSSTRCFSTLLSLLFSPLLIIAATRTWSNCTNNCSELTAGRHARCMMQKQQLIFDITLCGQWDSKVCFNRPLGYCACRAIALECIIDCTRLDRMKRAGTSLCTCPSWSVFIGRPPSN